MRDSNLSPDDVRHQSPSELSMGIERLVHKEVETQLAKEQKILKESIGLAAKIVGGAIALFLAIFTVFGLTTWQDIKQETARIVTTQAEELIQQADSEMSVKATLNDLLNRTIVSSYLVIEKRGSSRENTLASPAKRLAAHDWDRLRDWIKKVDLPLQDFSDTLAVLNLQSDERKKTDANRLLVELLDPPENSPYQWISKQPEKVESILSNFKHKDLGSTAIKLVSSVSLTDSVRGQAAAYVMEVEFFEGVENLLSIYRDLPWGKAKRNALITCLMLRPDLSEVVSEVRGLIAEEPNRDKVDTVFEIITALPYLESMIDQHLSQGTFRELSRDLILYAVKNGFIFSIHYPSVTLALLSEGSFDHETRAPLIYLSAYKSKSSASGTGSFSVSEFSEFEAYWILLAELANSGDLTRLETLLLRERLLRRYSPSSNPYEIRVMITADAGAKVAVIEEGGIKKELELATLEGVHVISADTINNHHQLLIRWIDRTGQITSSQLTGLSGSNFSFVLRKFETTN